MKTRILLIVTTAVLMLLVSLPARTQDNSSVAVKKFEVGAEFSTLTFNPDETVLGLGGRLSYNLNKHFALEAAAYFFPQACDYCGRHAGHTTEGLFGVKVGKRFQKWGIFAKARPGVISFSQGRFDEQIVPTNPPSFTFTQKRLTTFAADLGGVLEFYPSKRIITRFDFGSTIIHFGRTRTNFFAFDPVTGGFTLIPSEIPAQTGGTLQIMAGVGFRF
ncbi:MAG TPA: hypothetical protein VKD91_11130 [Pyrinomonadaceae bacterium]|nr:hypothetical protein [Pyrinomonadaceae bacterium]